MKKIGLTLLLSLLTLISYSQVGIGTDNPNASAIVDVESTTKGFLPPRLAHHSAVNNPVAGLLIYDLSDNCINVFTGSSWLNLCNSGGNTLPPGIDALPDGTESLSTKVCFDIAESNDNTSGCGSLLSRTSRRANFNESSTNTQTLTFTATSNVSNVRFYYSDGDNGAVLSLTAAADYSGNNITNATAEIKYNSALSSSDPNSPSTGLALGKSSLEALNAIFYVVYNDAADGTGTETKMKITSSIKDCSCSNNQTSGIQFSNILTSTGDVYSNGAGLYGYLGTGNVNNQTELAQVTLPNPIVSLVSGWSATFAIDNTGDLYAWGQNAAGQLGNGNSGAGVFETSPVKIDLPNGEKVIQITNSNGNTMALSDANKIYGWGQYGATSTSQFGPGFPTGFISSPTEGILPNGVTPVEIMNGAGANFFIASDGKLYSSGADNDNGRNTTPNGEFLEVVFPNNVKPLAVATTGTGTMAIGDDNNIYVWGGNYYGEQGTGVGGTSTWTYTHTPLKLTIAGMGTPVKIFKGYYVSFILDDQNKLFATGWNGHGNLGLGTSVHQKTFTEITLPTGVVPVDVLTFYQVTYVVSQDGKIYSSGTTAHNQILRTSSPTELNSEFHECTSPILSGITVVPN